MVDHVARGLDKLISQYSESENVKFLLQTFLEELQEVEDVNSEMLLQDSIDDAVGVQLDGIGEHLGKRREGLSDVDYRKSLNVQKVLNAGEGQHSTALQLWRTVLGSSSATLDEEFPAGVVLYSGTGPPTVEDLTIFSKVLPITVTVAITSAFDQSSVFVFEGGIGEGFGTIHDPYIGGKLIGRYSDISPSGDVCSMQTPFIFNTQTYYNFQTTYNGCTVDAPFSFDSEVYYDFESHY